MEILKKYWFVKLILLLFTLQISAQQIQKDYEGRTIRSSRHWIGIDYVGNRHIGHRLDIHLPEQELEKYPVIVSIYGSAWFSNNSKRATFVEGLGQALLKAGYAVVTINHRSSKDAKFPAQIHDVKAAIRFVRANAYSFDLDSSFIAITGWSSGGHLSAFSGATNHIDSFKFNGKEVDIEGNLGAFTETSSHVDAVVDWYGPTNFLMMDECGSKIIHNDEKSPESSLVGGAIQENKDACRLADPVTYISSTTAPFLIIHGDKDALVPYCQSEYLHQKLKASNLESELITVQEGGHGPGVLIPKYINQMISFFNQKRKEIKN